MIGSNPRLLHGKERARDDSERHETTNRMGTRFSGPLATGSDSN